ncbi:hypothetical protein [Micromonospora sp. NPDC050695]|uniref:hypothetical protein n=1 Tax=unclassified Micromonospora TaxID=2617518 RepID=UPI0033C5A670
MKVPSRSKVALPGRVEGARPGRGYEYGLARGTILHTVRVLVDEGLVYVVPGKGTFVKAR